jgi:hypothetical protein
MMLKISEHFSLQIQQVRGQLMKVLWLKNIRTSKWSKRRKTVSKRNAGWPEITHHHP